MRITTTGTITALIAVAALTGCGDGSTSDAAGAVPVAAESSAASSAQEAGGSTTAGEPAPADDAGSDDAGSDDAGSDTTPGPALTTVAAGVLALPQTSREGVTEWEQMGQCTLGKAQGAAGMRSVRDGDGAFEKPVTVAQVAAFPDVDSASAEAERMGETLRTCTKGREDATVRYAAQDVPIGAQGTGLSYEYFRQPEGDYAFGSYLIVTRRGNAVALTARVGGEGNPDGAREDVTELAQQAWSKLCVFDRTQGC